MNSSLLLPPRERQVSTRKSGGPAARLPAISEAAKILQRLDPAVRSRFHEPPLRIMVLDDEEPTRDELKRNLSAGYPGTQAAKGSLYCTGSYMAALDELVQSAKRGKPYDLLVLDIFLGQDQATGLDFLRDVHHKFCELQRSSKLPAIAINTSSMLSREVLSLHHRPPAESLAELECYSAGHAFPPALPHCPITFHHKTGGTAASLFTSIDIALFRRAANAPQLAAFLDSYKPVVLDHSVEEEVTHLAAERVMVTARGLGRILEEALRCGEELSHLLPLGAAERGGLLAELENFSYTLVRQRVLELAGRREMHTTEALVVVLHQAANKLERLRAEESNADKRC